MKKLNFMGIGPKIGIIVFPWLIITILLSVKLKETFLISARGDRLLFYAGLVLVIAGALLYFLTVPALLKGLKETRLMTSGTFYLCCNPLYTSILLFIIPGVSLMMNSWIVLTTSIAGYILFKMSIRKEYEEMEEFFGDDFRKYRSETPEFFPFPFRKLFRRS